MKGNCEIRQLRLTSEEGLPIRTTLLAPDSPRALVFTVHGFKGFREWGFFPWLSEQLAEAGYAACRFDMSRNGVADKPDSFERLDLFENDTYSIQLSDLRTVISAVSAEHRLASLPVFLLGHSRGGAVVTLGARDVPNLFGVVTWSAISQVTRWDEATVRQWRRDGFQSVMNQRTGQEMKLSTAVLEDCEANSERLDVIGAVGELSVPMLVIHGARDETVPPSEAETIASAAKEANLVLIEEATHTFGAMHPLVTIPSPLRLAALVTERFICGNLPQPCIERSRMMAAVE